MRNLLRRKKSTASKVVTLPDTNVESLATTTDRGFEVPSILANMYSHLVALKGLEEEGIFRVSGTESEMLQVYISANEGKPIADSNPHNVANLMKRWFKSFVGDKLLGEVPLAALQANPSLDVLEYLTEPRRSIFLWLVQVLLDIHRLEPKNKMNSRNIAIVWAPSLMGSSNSTNMLDVLTLTQFGMGILNGIIENNGDTNFPPPTGTGTAAPAAASSGLPAAVPATPPPAHTTATAGALAGVPMAPSSPSMSRGRDRSATVALGSAGAPPSLAELQMGALSPPKVSAAAATPPPTLSAAGRMAPPPRLARPPLSGHSRSSSIGVAAPIPAVRRKMSTPARPPPRITSSRLPPSLTDSQGSSCPQLPSISSPATQLPPPPGSMPPPPSPRSSVELSPAPSGVEPPPSLTRPPSVTSPPSTPGAAPLPPITRDVGDSPSRRVTAPPPLRRPSQPAVPVRKPSLPPPVAARQSVVPPPAVGMPRIAPPPLVSGGTPTRAETAPAPRLPPKIVPRSPAASTPSQAAQAVSDVPPPGALPVPAAIPPPLATSIPPPLESDVGGLPSPLPSPLPSLPQVPSRQSSVPERPPPPLSAIVGSPLPSSPSVPSESPVRLSQAPMAATGAPPAVRGRGGTPGRGRRGVGSPARGRPPTRIGAVPSPLRGAARGAAPSPARGRPLPRGSPRGRGAPPPVPTHRRQPSIPTEGELSMAALPPALT